jgi:hypothetical protein
MLDLLAFVTEEDTIVFVPDLGEAERDTMLLLLWKSQMPNP